jgi:hypothetical protein
VLTAETDRRESRRAAYNAYRMTEEIVKQHGEPALAAWVNAMSTTGDLNAASTQAFGVGYDALLTESMAWSATEASP